MPSEEGRSKCDPGGRTNAGGVYSGTSSRVPLSTNISSSLVAPEVMGQASHMPSPAPGDVSHVALSSAPSHGSPTRPSAQATGVHVDRAGFFERRVTAPTSGDPSEATPLLKTPQNRNVRSSAFGESNRSGGSYFSSTGSSQKGLS